MPPVDYIGLAHYRRYFDDTVTSKSIEAWLSSGKYDTISIEPISGLQANEMSLSYWITPENTHILFDAVLKNSPEYHDAINHYFFESNVWYHCNMSIMSWSRFTEYCAWLFPILEDLRSKVIPSGYSRVNRYVGYAAEALLGLYFTYHKMRVKTVGLYLSESDSVMRVNHFYENLGFAISRGLHVFVKSYLLGKDEPSHPISENGAIVNALRLQGITLDALHQSNACF